MANPSLRRVLDLAFSGTRSDDRTQLSISVVFTKVEIRPNRYIGCTSGSVRLIVDGMVIEEYTESEFVSTDYQVAEEEGVEVSISPKVSVGTEAGDAIEAELLTRKSAQKTLQETHYKGAEAILSAIPDPGNPSAFEWWFYLPRGTKIIMDCIEKNAELAAAGACNPTGPITVKVVGEPKGPIFLGGDFRELSGLQKLGLRIRLLTGRDFPRFDRCGCVALGTIR